MHDLQKHLQLTIKLRLKKCWNFVEAIASTN